MTYTASWNPSLYQDKHAFIYHLGENLIDVLSPCEGERILDIGCGTGHLTHRISQRGADVVGIDSSPEMISQARQLFPDLEFLVQDALTMHFAETFDAVFSNAAIHWIQQQSQLSSKLFSCLRKGGRLVVEMGGKENIALILQALKHQLKIRHYDRPAAFNPWFFPSVGEYSSLLEKAGFEINTAQYFARDTQLQDQEHGMADWLRMFSGPFMQDIPTRETDNIIQATAEALRATHYRHGAWYADYKRLRIVAIKP